MKKYNTYLRPDQINFLKKIGNASQFIRLAIDDFIIKSKLPEQEKIIHLYHAIEEMKEFVKAKRKLLAELKNKYKLLEEKVQKKKLRLKALKQIKQGNFILKSTYTSGLFFLIVNFGNEEWRSKIYAETKEEAEDIIRNTIAGGLDDISKIVNEAEENLRMHEIYQKTQIGSLNELLQNLEKIKKKFIEIETPASCSS